MAKASGFFFLGILFPGILLAANVDSLKTVLATARGENRITVLNELASAISEDNTGEAEKYAIEALRLSDSLGNKAGLAEAHNRIGYIAYLLGNNENGLRHFQLSLQLFRELGDESGQQDVLNGLGLINDANGNKEIALKHFSEALTINEKIKNQNGISSTLNNIGLFYSNQEDYTKAVEYFKRSLEIDIAQKDIHGQGYALSNIGMMYYNLDELDLATEYLLRALDIRRSEGVKYDIAKSLNNLGNVLEDAGKNDAAERYYLEALQIKRSLNNEYETAITLYNIGVFYQLIGKPDLAIKYLDEALAIANSGGHSDLKVDALVYLAEAMASKGDYKNAFELERESRMMEDSLERQSHDQQLAEMMVRYETEVKEREIDALKLSSVQDDLRMSKVVILIVVLLSVLVLLLAAGFFMYRSNRNKTRRYAELQHLNDAIAEKNSEIRSQRNLLEKQNKQILEINSNLEKLVDDRTANLIATNKELDTFLYESSHALRRPLLRIIALFELIQKEKDPTAVEELRLNVKTTVRNMNNTFRKLIEVNEINRRTPVLAILDFRECVESVLMEIDDTYNSLQTKVTIDVPAGVTLKSDKYYIMVVLRNLLENALQFYQINGESAHWVKVSLTQGGNEVQFSVSDNGTGIPEKLMSDLFTMFVRGTERSQGNGLGLFAVKKAVEKLGGSVSAKSKEGDGTTITVYLPV